MGYGIPIGIYHTNTTSDDDISTRTHKAKKKHVCISCQADIPKGTSYTKTVGTFDGYFVSRKWHSDCHEVHCQYINDQKRRA